MPIQTSPKRTLKGLYSNMNHSSGIPEGGLLEANNCVVERPGLLSKRKGFKRYGPKRSATLRSLMDYNGSIVTYAGTTLSCDAEKDGVFVDWDGAYAPPDDTHQMRGASVQKNFYFTTSEGPHRNESPTSDPRPAGMPEALDLEIETYGDGDGWWPHNSRISYVTVWSREDSNGTIIVGAPSYRNTALNDMALVSMTHDGFGTISVIHNNHGFSSGDIVTISDADVLDYEGAGKVISVIDDNSYSFDFGSNLGPSIANAGKDYFVKVKLTVPVDVVAGDKWELYRTFSSGDETSDPGDDHMLVARKEITAAELAAGTVEFSDTVLEVSLGEFLYTNAFQETISQANDRPPMCTDIVSWRGHMFVGNPTYKSEKEIHLSEIESDIEPNRDIKYGDSIRIWFGDESYRYTFDRAEHPDERKFLFRTGESTTEKNIEKTMRSLVRTINRDPANSRIYAHYTSGPLDPSGKVLIRSRRHKIGDFFITVSKGLSGLFKDEIPYHSESGRQLESESFISKAENIPNGIAYSKVLEPDAMPKINVIRVGSANSPIQRILPLKTSLIILKEDGAFRLTGNTPSTFVLQDLDPSVSFAAPNAAVMLNDSIYCLSSQGILKIGENGTTAISYPIEDQIRNIPSFTGYEKLSFAVANEQNRVAIIFAQSHSGDRSAKIGWVYNYMTKEWTTWTKDVSCGTSILGERDLFLGHSIDSYVLRQRGGGSERNSADYIDEDIPVTVTDDGRNMIVATAGTSSPAIQFTYSYGMTPRPGFMFQQQLAEGSFTSKITSITAITGPVSGVYMATVVLESAPGSDLTYVAGDATVGLPIDSTVKWAPDNIGVSEAPKQFTYAMLTMETGTALTNELGFYSDAVRASEWVNEIKIDTPTGWGHGKWGAIPWGNEESLSVVPIVSAVPRQHQRCRELTVMYRHRVANEEFNIESIALRYKSYRGKLVRTPA